MPPLRHRLTAAAWAVAFSAADVALTLGGQPAGYWHGDRERAVEGNPLARPFLVGHPGLFVGLAVAWWAVIVGTASVWRSRWAVRSAAAVILSHAFGAAAWLARGPGGWPAAGLVLLAAAVVARRLWGASALSTK